MTANPKASAASSVVQHPTVVRFDRYRVSCPTCGVVTEGLDVLPVRGPRVTHPLAHLVYELCKVATHKAVGILLDLHRETVKTSTGR